MLGADVPGAHPVGFAHSQLDDALGTGRQALTGRVAGGALSHVMPQDTGDHLVGEAVFGQHAVGNALLLTQQTQQQMLTAYVIMAHILGGFLRQTQGFLSTRGEFILIHKWSHPFDLLKPVIARSETTRQSVFFWLVAGEYGFPRQCSHWLGMTCGF